MCKYKCHQDGNSFRNNLRVRVNLVHPTLGGRLDYIRFLKTIKSVSVSVKSWKLV